MNYRVLTGENLEPLLEKMRSRGEPVPDKRLCAAFVAQEGERIVAELMIQKVDLIEPVTAEPGYGHVLGELFQMAQEFIEQSNVNRVLMHPEHRVMKRWLHRIKASPFAEFWQWLRE